MKGKLIKTIFFSTWFILNSCADSQQELISLKRPVKAQYIEHYEDYTLSENSYPRFYEEYFYNDMNQLIEERNIYENTPSELSRLYTYNGDKLSQKKEYFEDVLLSSTTYEYKENNIVRSNIIQTNRLKPQELIEKTNHYFYDADSRLIKIESSSGDFSHRTKKFEYLSDNMIKETSTDFRDVYILHELDTSKQHPFKNVSSYDSYLRTSIPLFKIISSKTFFTSNDKLKEEIKNEQTYSDDGLLIKNVSLHNNVGYKFETEYTYN